MNIKPQSIISLMHNFPNDMPFELANEVSTWNIIIKSPYSHSYYNAPVGWDFKEHDSLRIANHWNFTSQDKTHCETTTDVPNNTHWSIGRFDSKLGKYVIIKTIPNAISPMKELNEYKLLLVKLRINN